MTISVIIPAYNEERYLKRCLESLKNQTVKPDEVIIVDNNSTDNTLTIAKQYQVKITHEKKQGISFARNKGFNLASKEILVRCDADVILPKNFIKKVKEYFSSHPQIAAFSSSGYFYDLPFCFFFSIIFTFYFYLLKIILGHYPLMGPSMALKKTIWQKVKKEVCNNDKLVHEDIDLSIHIAKYEKLDFYPSLKVAVSGRRIKNNPFSFFIEYPIRFIKMLKAHRN